jgi:MFS family permease
VPPIGALVSALGIAQIISWGSLFYAIGVLGPAMTRDLGVSELFLFSAFTAGLLVSGALSPRVGRMVDRHGGRFVLSAGSITAAAALALLAAATHPAGMVAGWLLAGVAMAASLYDPAFATLSQHTGQRYRRAVTMLTLFGGLASTVFWPLSKVLMDAWGWRATWGILAAMNLLICLPIHRFVIPRWHYEAPSGEAGGQAEVSPAIGTVRLRWLSASFAIATFIFTVIAVHLVSLLTAAGLSATQAVGVAMLMGPMQVVGRAIELAFSARVNAVTVGLVAFGLMLVSLLALISVAGMGVAAIVFVVTYGFGNGVLTIVRGTAPAELFGRKGLGSLLGYIAGTGLFARAVAPAAFTGLMSLGLSRHSALAALAALALAGMGTYRMAIRPEKRAAASEAAADAPPDER